MFLWTPYFRHHILAKYYKHIVKYTWAVNCKYVGMTMYLVSLYKIFTIRHYLKSCVPTFITNRIHAIILQETVANEIETILALIIVNTKARCKENNVRKLSWGVRKWTYICIPKWTGGGMRENNTRRRERECIVQNISIKLLHALIKHFYMHTNGYKWLH